MIVEFLLDNTGFSDSITVVQDAPKFSRSSSASSGQPQCSCARCPSRMSSIDHDKHLICICCRGCECSVIFRCEECENWSKEEMLAHEKIRKSLASKSKGGVNLPLKLLRSLPLLLRPVPMLTWTIDLRHNMIGC